VEIKTPRAPEPPPEKVAAFFCRQNLLQLERGTFGTLASGDPKTWNDAFHCLTLWLSRQHETRFGEDLKECEELLWKRSLRFWKSVRN